MASNDTYDLLAISKTLDDINGEQVGSGEGYGMNYNILLIGMSGQEMVDKMNSNWKATDAQLKSFRDEIELTIISNSIKEIKLENGILYYTEDYVNWISMHATWGNIIGDINSQTDLMNVLGTKVNETTFNELKTIVNKNKSDILTLVTNVQSISDNLNNLSNIISGTNGVIFRLNAAEVSLNTKISSSTVKAIRTQDGTSLEFTTDNQTWHPVSDIGAIEWGNVVGDINNQADLIAKFNEITTSLSDFDFRIENIETSFSTLETNVDTRLDSLNSSKVGSTDIKAVRDNEGVFEYTLDNETWNPISTSSGAASMSVEDYNALIEAGTIDENTIYFVN